MKKLVSIFAALAMVGALAAQKRKAPAKKAAAPAPVAAPAAPAAVTAPAPVVAAPAASGQGLGLSIEARGSWTMRHGTSDSKLDGTNTATSEAYKLSNSNGFGGGLTVGYDIAKNLGLVASFDYRAISTRKWDGTKPQGPGTNQTTIEQTTNTSVVGIGLRPSVAAWGGTIYAGMGFAMVLPYKNETTVDVTLANVNPAVNGSAKSVFTAEWNLGLGVYAELGYNYAINDMLFVGVGVRGLVATSNNDGKSRSYTISGDAGTIGAANGANKEAFPIAAAGTKTVDYAASGDPTKISAYQSQGITDMTVSVTVGARF